MMNRWIHSSRPGHFLLFVALAAMMPMMGLVPARAADAEPGDDHLLILDQYICRGDMRAIGECLNEQNDKADRWLEAVVGSYARLAAAYVAELRKEASTEPFDQVAQLRESQALFEQFRDSTAELVYRTGYPGSGSAIGGARARFRLTVDRARFLLSICNSRRSAKLDGNVDLTIIDWCQGQ